MASKESLAARSVRVGDCLIWQGGKNQDGYGYVWHEGKNRATHRVSYELHRGPIPAGLELMHSCDNPSCIEPAHLTPGTHSENILDMVAKGRREHAAGTRHGMSVLTPEQVATIRQRYRPYCRKNSTSALARELGISQRAVWCALKGETWSTVQ